VHAAVDGLTRVLVLDATDDMALLMSQADLAIGTCGVAAWERCAMGLPCLVVVTADNQRDDARILAHRGAVEHLGEADSVGPSDWRDALIRALGDSKRVQQMGVEARCVMQGRRLALAELEGALVDAGY
jgi:UDP-2,4-diacetamido-2,4,6-trideoxy-beta-L-altropyranose hydrolase